MPNSLFCLNRAQCDLLYQQLETLLKRYAPDHPDIAAMAQSIMQHYQQPHRHYHNLSHIHHLLKLAQQYVGLIKHPDQVQFAIWFHDIIYDPQQADNELKSAETATKILKSLEIKPSIIQTIEAMIIMTTTHDSPNLSADGEIFSDLDLTILGADETTYHAYAQAIRAEYHWLSDDTYRQGRSQVLADFLQRPTLYQTPTIRQRFETQARKNIALELKQHGFHFPR